MQVQASGDTERYRTMPKIDGIAAFVAVAEAGSISEASRRKAYLALALFIDAGWQAPAAPSSSAGQSAFHGLRMVPEFRGELVEDF